MFAEHVYMESQYAINKKSSFNKLDTRYLKESNGFRGTVTDRSISVLGWHSELTLRKHTEKVMSAFVSHLFPDAVLSQPNLALKIPHTIKKLFYLNILVTW